MVSDVTIVGLGSAVDGTEAIRLRAGNTRYL